MKKMRMMAFGYCTVVMLALTGCNTATDRRVPGPNPSAHSSELETYRDHEVEQKASNGHTVNMPGGMLIIYGEHTIDPSYLWDVAEKERNAVIAACRAFANRFAMQFERYGTTTLSRHIGLSEQVESVLGEKLAKQQYDGLIQLSIEIRENDEEPNEYNSILNAEFFSLIPCPDEERAVQIGDKHHSVDYVIDTTSPGRGREVIVDYLAIDFFEALKSLGYLDISIMPDK